MTIFSPRRALLIGLAAIALVGCAAKPELSRIQDPDVDFRSYHSFAFILKGSGNYSLIERRLMAATRDQLERRGYTYDESDPQLLVNIAAELEERQGLRPAAGGLPGLDGVQTEDYRFGRLAIDVADRERGAVVWHGIAEGRVSPEMLRDAGTAAEKAVSAVFEGFPVKPRSGPASTSRERPSR